MDGEDAAGESKLELRIGARASKMGKIYKDGQLVGYCQPGWEWLSEVASRAAKVKKPQELGSHPNAYALGVAMKAEYQRQHPELFPESEAQEAPKTQPLERLCVTEDELAAMIGVSQRTIAREANGKLRPIHLGGKGKRGKKLWVLSEVKSKLAQLSQQGGKK